MDHDRTSDRLDRELTRFGEASMCRDPGPDLRWLDDHHPTLARHQLQFARATAHLTGAPSWFGVLVPLDRLPPTPTAPGHRLEGAVHQLSGRLGLLDDHLGVLERALRSDRRVDPAVVLDAAGTLLHEHLHLVGGETREQRLLILQATADAPVEERRLAEGMVEMATAALLRPWCRATGLTQRVPGLERQRYAPKYPAEIALLTSVVAWCLPEASARDAATVVTGAVALGGGAHALRHCLERRQAERMAAGRGL